MSELPLNEVSAKPRTLRWFTVYCLVVGFLYFAILAWGAWLVMNAGEISSMLGEEASRTRAAAWTYMGVGAVFGTLFVAGAFPKQRSAFWLIGALLIAMSLGLCITVPFGFPLFYFWLQPELRHWFGRD